MKRKILFYLSLILFFDFLSCNGAANGKSKPSDLFALAARAVRLYNQSNVVLEGTVKGPGSITNASIQVIAVPDNGQCVNDDGTVNGSPIATAKSDSNGKYTVTYKKTGNPVCVVVLPSDGSQVDVFTPTTRTNAPKPWTGANNLTAIINEPTNSGFSTPTKTANVTPFTRMAQRRYAALSSISATNGGKVFLGIRGTRAINSDKPAKVEFGNNTAATLLDKANGDVMNAFFPKQDKKTFTLDSSNVNDSTYALRLGAIAITADTKGGGTADGSSSASDFEKVINFMEEDFSDGRFDGKKVDDSTGKIAQMTTTDFGGVVASKTEADGFLKSNFKSAQQQYDTYDTSVTSTSNDLLFCETDSLDAACSITVLPGSDPETWIFDDAENFIDLGETGDMGAVGYGTYGSTKTWYMTIVNGGGTDLKLKLPLTITGTQFVVTEQPDAVVAAGDATYFTVEFTPTSASTYTQSMTVTSNDPLYSPYQFYFTGTGQDLNTNLALWWSFDYGDASDDGPNGFDGTPSDPSETIEDRWEDPDTAFYFDNSASDDITCSPCTMGATTAVTISAWIAPDDLSSGNYTIMNRGTAANPDFRLAFTTNGTKIQFVTSTTGPSTSTLNYTILADDYIDYWTHVAAVFSGTQMTLYVDGVQVAQTTRTSGNVINSSSFQVGSKTSTADYFSGVIDEVRVYNRGLTAAQIAALANQD